MTAKTPDERVEAVEPDVTDEQLEGQSGGAGRVPYPITWDEGCPDD